MKKILFLVQLPPPIHGAAIINQRVCEISKKSKHIKTFIYRLNYATNFKEMHDSALIKSKFLFKLLYSVLICLLKNKPQITYIAFSPFGLGFYRDFGFVLLSNLFRSRPYLHLHGTGLSKNASYLKSKLITWMLKKSKLILISDSLITDVSKFIDNKNIAIIDNCVDNPGHYENYSTNKLNLFYLANLDERKGVKTTIEICSLLKEKGYDVTLQIAGSDTAYLTKLDLKTFIEKNYANLANSIFLIGPVYGKEKDKLFKSADIFIYPSQHDAAPLVIIEALSYGVPVVCSNQGALPDMIKNGINGYISDNNDPILYTELIIKCLNNIKTLKINSRNYYLNKYNPAIFENKILDLFLNG